MSAAAIHHTYHHDESLDNLFVNACRIFQSTSRVPSLCVIYALFYSDLPNMSYVTDGSWHLLPPQFSDSTVFSDTSTPQLPFKVVTLMGTETFTWQASQAKVLNWVWVAHAS